MRRGLTYFGRRSVGNFPAGSGTNPFFQSGPTLDLNFAGVPTDPLQAATLQDQTLALNYIVQTYQVAAQYAIWESGVGLASKNFSDIVTFTRASTATYFDSAGVLQSAAVDAARFDYDPSTLALRGLLIEEQRTNSIRNNTMQGAVAGTPGTAPTNWSVNTSGGGVTREIVGTGTESGITYIDIRVSGTTTGALFFGIRPEIATQIAAANGQTWTSTFYVRLVAGSLTNITQVNHVIQFNDAAGAGLTFGVGGITPTTAALNTQRFTRTTTATNASTAFLQSIIQVEANSGVAIDITLRIGLPQLELAAFATSVIPTTTTALTRSADVASVNTLSPWYNATEGTLFAEYVASNSAQNNAATAFSDGTFNNRMIIRATNASAQTAFIGVASASSQWAGVIATALLNTITKSAFGYKVDDVAWVRNGGTVGTDTPPAIIPTVTGLKLGADGDGTLPLNGYLRRITYYPRRLANADLQTLTA